MRGAWVFVVALLPPTQEAGRVTMGVWDTAVPGGEALSPASFDAKAGWTRVTDPQPLKGDAVVTNGWLVAVFRRKTGAVELHSEGMVPRARLVLQTPTGEPATRFEALTVPESNRGGAVVAVSARTSKDAALSCRFRLGRGDVSIEAQPGPGAGRLRVEAPARFAVLPDFFADDILIDAARIPGTSAEVPSENLLLHLAGPGDAVVVTVFQNREQEVRIALEGAGAERRLAASEVEFGASQKVWVAVLAGPRVWHSVDVKPENANQVMPLDWTMPFLASWRVDFTRPNGLADSWDMLLQHKKHQDYIKPAWPGGPAEPVNDATRRRFTEVLGFFPYPCWSDPERRGYIQPLELTTRTKFVPVLQYRGPAVLFPMGRVPETPPEAFTVVDVLRNTLGVGPCENILDLEGQKQEYKGVATCNARDTIEEIYKKGEQKKRRDEILKALDDTHAFVTHIRARITLYVEFGRKVRAFLAEQKKARHELSGPVDELDRIAQEIEARVEERASRIKSPADVAKMNDEFRKSVLDAEGPDALAKVKTYGEELTRIGGNQDKLVSECRWVVRTLRQQSALLLASDARLAPVAAELRARSQEVLKNPSRHERARQ